MSVSSIQEDVKQKMDAWGIHWFRRDLRVAGNPALQWSWKEHQGRVVGLFCFDSKFLKRPDFSQRRFAFFIETLVQLKQELESLGGDLWVIDDLPVQAFQKIHSELKKSGKKVFKTVSLNRDYEPFARKRDEELTTLLRDSLGVELHSERDHLLIEPWEVLKPSGSGTDFYQVYSPFARRWFEKLDSSVVQSRIESQKKGLDYLKKRLSNPQRDTSFRLSWKDIWNGTSPCYSDSLQAFREANSAILKGAATELPSAGSFAAYQQLLQFKDRISHYRESRDIPSVPGTSKLSIYLKNGSLASGQVISELQLDRCQFKSDSSETKFMKELVWREFYYSILYHKPQVEKEAFLEKYQNLKWENNLDYFEMWKEGQTGYPIVDAGMRQLKKEGWMHNRVRMIVASFLVKDLLIDWRWGENHFMKELLDGDLAPNNGGWQWAASTGCDPQPYFRIFNPELQSLKFDPEGDYIAQYVPELAGLEPNQRHAPHRLGQALLKKIGYSKPVVDHASRKAQALALFKV